MATKGLVYVPPDGATGWQGEEAGLQLVANRPLVAHALDALADQGIEELAVLAPAQLLSSIRGALATERGDRVTHLALEERADLGAALAAGAAFAQEAPAVLHLATGLLGRPLQPLRQSVEGPRSTTDLHLLLDQGPDPESPLDALAENLLGVSALGGGGDRLGLAGIAGFGPGALTRAAAFGPCPAAVASAPLAFVTIAQRFAAGGLTVTAGIGRGWCGYSCDPQDLLELNRSALDHQPAAPGPILGFGNRIEGRVMVHPTAEVDSSVLLGPCVIGAGARITESYVGPYTTIGPRVLIEGSEVVRSVIAEGARVRHVGGRIEGSTIGHAANIFRDFGLPQAMRLHVGAGAEVALD